MTEEERLKGAEILHKTGCKVGQHIWMKSGSGEELKEPHPIQRCVCGLMEWAPVGVRLVRPPAPGKK